MSDSIYAKEVEQLKCLHEDAQKICELLRAIAAKLGAEKLHSNKDKLAEVVALLPDALKTGT